MVERRSRVASRRDMGLPSSWSVIMFWLTASSSFTPLQTAGVKNNKLKHPEIPKLEKYGGQGSTEFWSKFPFNNLPSKPETKIRTDVLKSKIEEVKHKLLRSEIRRAEKCIQYLESGGPAFQKGPIGPCWVKNSKQSLELGQAVSDTIASWVTKQYVAGPFTYPPLPNIRVNSILAVPQPDKTRICINVSLPEGRSFNDNIEKSSLEKVKMASARQFGQMLMESGRNSLMAKPDIVDAYKNIPARTQDLRLQGFMWEGRFFVELRQMFGACSSVQNFDIVANTIKTVAKVGCEIPSRFVLRQLDDVPIVAPGKSGWCEDFLAAYKHLCGQINLELAEDCPEFKKSFGPTRKGKILGIWFNSETLCWKLPEEKRISSLLALAEVSKQANPSLLQLQSLMGRLNVISVMCPFMNTFKFNLNAVLSSLLKGYSTTIMAKALDDIRIWTNRLSHPTQWNPICPERSEPPLTCYSFSSDAAGFADNSIWTGQIGCGVLGLDEEN
jgi:hypothetical protein